jgi:Tfp pilus assembly protein PilF
MRREFQARNKQLVASVLPGVLAFCFLLVGWSSALAQADTPAARLERAATLIGNNRLAEAEQQLNSVLKIAPNEAAALNLLGTIRAKQGKLDKAENLFSRAVKADNQLIGAHMNLAYLYLLKGEPEKTALKLKEVLRLDPSNADAAYRLAWLLLSQGRFEECIAFVERAKQGQTPTFPLLNLLGDAYLKKGDADRASKSYRQVLDAQGGNADALLGMAQVSQLKRDASAAALYLSRAREVITSSPDQLYKYALTALNSGLNSEAVSALKQAIELRPNESAYYFLLGLSWIKNPDLQEAEEAFRQSLKLRPDNAQGQLYLGYVLFKQKKYPEAREWLEKSLRKGAGTPESFYYLGVICQEQNEDGRAVEFLEQSIQLDPAFALAHVALGSTYLKLKNYARAQEELEKGVELNPEDSRAHYNLALLYSRLRKQARAQEEMSIVEKLKGDGKAQTKDADTPAPSPTRPR